MSIKAVPCHLTRGRIRLRILESGPEESLRSAAEKLLAVPSTLEVRFSALTHSLTLFHCLGSNREYLDSINQLHLIQLTTPNDQEPLSVLYPPRNGFLKALDQLDERIRYLTAEECNLRIAGALIFAGLGLSQIKNGMGLPAGLTLLVNASRIFKAPTGKKEE